MKLESFVKSQKKFSYFALNSMGILVLKICIFYFLQFFISSSIAYLFTHILILIVSYLIHCKLTFQTSYSQKNFIYFIKSVFLIKFIDYFLFLFLLEILKVNSLVIIVLISILIFLIRFLILKKVFE